MTDIVEELRREKAPLYYTDSVMRAVECKMPDSLHLQAADEIERLRKALREINRWNDHPGRYSEPLQRMLNDAIDTSDVKF